MKGNKVMSQILEETQLIMKKYKIKAKKALGQNFLINQNVVDKIVDSSHINKQKIVIKIGPRIRNFNKTTIRKSRKSNLC